MKLCRLFKTTYLEDTKGTQFSSFEDSSRFSEVENYLWSWSNKTRRVLTNVPCFNAAKNLSEYRDLSCYTKEAFSREYKVTKIPKTSGNVPSH